MTLKKKRDIKSVFHVYQTLKGKLIYFRSDGGVKCISLSSFNELWKYESKELFYKLIVKDNNVLIFNKNNNEECLNAENGLLQQSCYNIQDIQLSKVVNGKVLTSTCEEEINYII